MKDMGALLIAIGAKFLSSPAHAWDLPSTVCTGLGGCQNGGIPPLSNILSDSMPTILETLMDFAGVGALAMIVWAGFNMVVASMTGDVESKTSQYKWGVINALLGLALAISSEAIVAFVGTQEYGQSSASGDSIFTALFGSGLSILLTLLNVAFILAIMFAGIRMVYGQGAQEEYTTARKIVFWAILGAVIVNIAYALVRAMSMLFGFGA